MVLASALVPVLQTLPDKPLSDSTFFLMPTVADSVFILEMFIRWFVCPSCTVFLTDIYNLLDIAVKGRLRHWGYTEEDLRLLFDQFDEEDNGELSLKEFSTMVATMRLGFSPTMVERLFNAFD